EGHLDDLVLGALQCAGEKAAGGQNQLAFSGLAAGVVHRILKRVQGGEGGGAGLVPDFGDGAAHSHGGGITAGDDGGGGLAGVVIHDARLVVALRLVGHGGGESGRIEMVGDEIGLIGGNAQTAGAVGFGAGMSAHGSDG